jgi:hypothetical protein
MQDDTIGWDPISVYPADPPLAIRIYALVLIVALIATVVRLATLWMAAPPFRLSRQVNIPAYLGALQTSRNYLKQWMACVLLGWGIIVTDSLHRVCAHWLESKVTPTYELLLTTYRLCQFLTGALMVMIFIFLVQWHVLTRIETLKRRTVSPTSH